MAQILVCCCSFNAETMIYILILLYIGTSCLSGCVINSKTQDESPSLQLIFTAQIIACNAACVLFTLLHRLGQALYSIVEAVHSGTEKF